MQFSILIAHYQNWDYFQVCYQSILNQKIQDLEIVIVDDCSADESYSKLKNLAQQDTRIKLYRNSENRGVGFTKNHCLTKAKGDILMFVDPDDALYENALETIYKAYHENPKSSVVYSQMMLCDDELKPKNVFPRTRKIKNKDPFFVNIDTSVAHLFTFKRSAFEQIENIDVNLKSAVDQDLYLKLYEVATFYYVAQPLYKYRLHAKGVSQEKNKTKAKDDFKKVIRRALERRGIEKVNSNFLAKLSDDELYQLLSQRENSVWRRIQRKLHL